YSAVALSSGVPAICGACVKVRRCASASLGSGTARKRDSLAFSSAELRKPNSGFTPFGDEVDCEVPPILVKNRLTPAPGPNFFILLLWSGRVPAKLRQVE